MYEQYTNKNMFIKYYVVKTKTKYVYCPKKVLYLKTTQYEICIR